MTPTQQPYDEWLNHLEEVVNLIRNLGTVPVLVAANSVPIFERALEELRKRDRAIEIAKKALEFDARLDSFSPHRDCTGKEHFRKGNREALQKIEEVLK